MTREKLEPFTDCIAHDRSRSVECLYASTGSALFTHFFFFYNILCIKQRIHKIATGANTSAYPKKNLDLKLDKEEELVMLATIIRQRRGIGNVSKK